MVIRNLLYCTVICIVVGVGSLLAGCTYVAKSEVSIAPAKLTDTRSELQALIKALAHHYDGCYSPRNAKLTTSIEKGVERHIFQVLDVGVELQLMINPASDGIIVTFNQWAEHRFTPKAAACYKQMLKVVNRSFDKQRLTVIETCQGACLD